MRFKVAELDDMGKGFDIHERGEEAPRRGRRAPGGARREIIDREDATEYALPLSHPL